MRVRDPAQAIGVVLALTVAASCGGWVTVPGGGKQTLRFSATPAGAVLTLEEGNEKRELGAAPAEAVVGYEVEEFEANHHCWWLPGLSAATATAGGIVLGAAGLGQCVDATGAATGTSESSCEGQWRAGSLNPVGVAGTAMLATGGAGMVLGSLLCGLEEARDGAEHPVYRTVRVKARAPGHKTLGLDVDVPSPVKDIELELEVGGSDDPDAARPDPDAPNLAKWSRSTFALGVDQPNSYALIVGVEYYAKTNPVPGARRDAERFRELCSRTLGVSPEHQRVALDQKATKREIEGHLKWLRSRLGRGKRLYFYYAGQGAAGGPKGAPYLLPHDGDPAALERTALGTSWLLDELAATAATEVLAIVDAGFAGNGGRSIAVPGAKPVTRVAEPVLDPVVAMLAASTGVEVAGAGASGEGGLLSVAVSHGIGSGKADRNRDGQITLREITEWVTPHVARLAAATGRQQTPALVTGTTVDPAVFVVVHDLKASGR